MEQTPLQVRRLPQRLERDASRTIARFFWPATERRATKIIDRILSLSPTETSCLLQSTLHDYGARFHNVEGILLDHYRRLAERVMVSPSVTLEQRLLLGAYFTMEYAFESAALFNPSIALANDATHCQPGETPFIMSLRAVGEGHVSSIVFRKGAITADGDIRIDPTRQHTQQMRVIEDRMYEKDSFVLKLIEMGAYVPLAVEPILDRLGESFTMPQLMLAVEQIRRADPQPPDLEEVVRSMVWLARSNYQIQWEQDSRCSMAELVLFPVSEAESKGMEDMRLVRFTEDDGSIKYYGTYTAFDGRHILPQILEMSKPGSAEVHTLGGRYAQNKGLALFPRKLDGWYAMIARVDGENIYMCRSKNIRFWNDAELLAEPLYPWEFVQIGNCGPPIETEAGWLLLTHGVGPMRRYCIGVALLDRDDPSRIIGRLDQPLLMPTAEERSGYVPNVVYSCGGMIHNGMLILPYGISDAATGFATLELSELLERLRPKVGAA